MSTAISVATTAADRYVPRGRNFRPFFRHDRRLFAEVSRLIYDILAEFYHEAAGRPVLTGTVIAHQTFGDQLRFNPHFHAIVLEGGFDEEGTFFYIPLSGLQSMTELFREVGANPRKRAWARLLMKVYEVDPFVCQSEVRT